MTDDAETIELIRTPEDDYEERILEILQAFLKSNHPIVHLNFKWPKNTTKGEVKAVAGSLRSNIANRKLDVRVLIRHGEIYLQRLNRVSYRDIRSFAERVGITLSPELAATPLEGLELSVRAYHVLVSKGLKNLGEVAAAPVSELLVTQNCGLIIINEIDGLLRMMAEPGSVPCLKVSK